MQVVNLGAPENTKIAFLKWAFRILICGKGGSGKTVNLLNIIYRYAKYDKIYIYSRHLGDKDYIDLIKHFEGINKYARRKLKDPNYTMYVASDSLEGMVTNEELDPSIRNLIIIDDFMMAEKRLMENIEDLFISCRHANTSIIFLAQSYSKVSKIIRGNVNYVVLYAVAQKREIQGLAQSLAMDIDYKTFYRIFTDITKQKYGFMVIDTSAGNDCPYLKYRNGWDGLVITNPEDFDLDSENE